MKKYLLILAIFLGLNGAVMAQNKAGEGRIEALKIAYLTKKLNLSPAEAQKFWPVYNKYTAEIREAQIEARKNKTSEIDKEDKILSIRKRFQTEFARALTEEKANSFFRVEREFAGLLQKEMMERRQQRLDRNRPRQQ